MAESFKNQVDALTGFASTEDLALADWLTAGARYVLNAMPLSKLSRVASNTNFTNSQDAEGKRIISVLRKDANNSNRYMPCRELEPHQMGTVHDSAYMEYATTSDPAYIIHNQVINTFPESAASNDSRVVGINTDITVADSATSIDNFPDEAEYSVVLYAARNAVERLMNNIQTNSDITTALTATNTELDETQAICDLINTQVDAAVTEIAETVTNIDDNVDTALTAMNTSADKMNAAIDLANAEFDKAETEADSAEAEADDAAVATALGLINTQVDAAVALISTGSGDNAVVNKLALVETNISNAATEIGLAKAEAAEIATQTDNSGDFETALDAINTAVDKFQAASADPALYGDEDVYTTGVGFTKVKDALDNATNLINNNQPSATTDAFGAQALEDTEIVQSALNIAQTEQSRARVHLEEFTTAVNGLQAEINGFATEVTSRANFTGAKGQAVQAFINTAQAFISEAQTNLALANGYNNAVGAYLNAAQGYAAEIQAYVTTSQMFIGTASNRISVGNAYLSEANTRVAEVNSYGAEVQSRLSQVGAQGNVAASYIAAAQGYANEITSKINIASSYLQEAQSRLSIDNSKYQWYTQQYQMIDAQYKESLQVLGIETINQKKESKDIR